MNRLILRYFAIAFLSLAIVTGAAACGSDDSTQDETKASTTSTKSDKKDKKTSTREKTSTQRTNTGDNDGTLPDAEQIQEDLIDQSIVDPYLGEWFFEDPDEFVEFDIVDSEVSADPDGFTTAEFIIDVKLMDINDGREYNGQLNVTYERRAEDLPWRLVDVSGEYRSAGPSI